jgi:hypothetical protein
MFCMKLVKWTSSKIVQTIALWSKLAHPGGHLFPYVCIVKKNILVWRYKAKSFDIWYIISFMGPLLNLL